MEARMSASEARELGPEEGASAIQAAFSDVRFSNMAINICVQTCPQKLTLSAF
jgi:hypothetical protein